MRDGLAVQYADNGTISPKAGRILRDIMYQENSVNNTAKPLKSMGTPEFNNAYKNITNTGEALLSIQPMSMKVSNKNTGYNPKSVNISYTDVPPPGSFMEWQQKNQAPKFPDAKFLPAPEINYDAKAVNEIQKKQNVSYEHAKIMHYAEQWKDVPEYKWGTDDAVYWKLFGGDEFIHKEKLSFVRNYKDVIKDASEKYDIPPLLLAGVAYVEYGGDPMFIDDIAYTGRLAYENINDDIKKKIPDVIDKPFEVPSDHTSFGNTSMQIRRALETLGYKETTNNRIKIIFSLKNPIQNIYLAAAHLSNLKDIDFKEKDSDELTNDEIKIIAGRYNVGPDYSLEQMKGSTDYGMRIYDNQEDILKALGLIE